MTKILLISDTHGNLEPAKRIIEYVQPDRIIHLGDMQADARKLKEVFPQYRLEYVPGNCDMVTGPACIGIATVNGCRIYYTHGHEHHVKTSLLRLSLAAREAQAQVAAFGHTHQPYCEFADGLWMVNPGSCQRDANYALVEVARGAVSCSIHSL